MCRVLTEKHAHKAPSNYIGHSKHQRRLQAAELISVLLRRGTCYFSSLLPGTGAVTFPALAGSLSIHPSYFSLSTLSRKKVSYLPF